MFSRDDRSIIAGVMGLMVAAATAFAGIDYSFKPADNPMDSWKICTWHLKELGKNIKLVPDGGRLALTSGESNCMAYLVGSEHAKGSVELKGSFVWPNAVWLLGRLNPDNGDHLSLGLFPKARRLELGRMKGGRYEKLAEAPAPDSFDGKAFALEMRLDGAQILAGANGTLALKAPDDGLLPKGVAGIRGNAWTNVEIASMKVDDNPRPLPQAKAPEPPLKTGGPTLAVGSLRDWDVAKAWSRADGMRQDISLNQLWEFCPVDAPASAMPKEWGYFMVPGHWSGGEITNYMHLADGARVINWNGKAVEKYPCAWYRRTVNVQADWKDRKIVLFFENVNGAPRLYVNGKEAAKSTLDNNSFQVDVSGLLKPGEANEIAIYVDGADKYELRSGLFGNVWLKSMPKINLGLPKITCSYRQKELSLQLDGQLPDGTVELAISDPQGKVETSRTFKANDSGLYVLPWLAAKLWSPDSPSLYKAELVLKDVSGKVLDACARRFGFREFYVENGEYMLNGNPIVLKFDTGVNGYWTPDWQFNPDYFRCQAAALKAMGLNGAYMAGDAPETAFEIADELGLMLLVWGEMPNHEQLSQKSQAWKEQQELDARQYALDPRLRNHPSAIGILVDVWYNYHAGCTNPEFIGLKLGQKERLSFSPEGELRTAKGGDPNMVGIPALRKQRLDAMVEIYRKHLPEFELFTGGSGEVGNIYASHLYHTWGAPLDELRAFFERWKQRRDTPIFVGETAIPYIGALYEIDNFNGGGNPLFLENGARLLGQQAYRHRGVYTTRPFHDVSPDGFMANTSEPDGDGRYVFEPDIYQELLSAYTRGVFPFWRADGLSGFGSFCFALGAHNCFAGQTPVKLSPMPANLGAPGYKPEKTSWGNAVTPPFKVSPADPQLRPLKTAFPFRRAMANVTFFIAGPESDYYLQDHSFLGGDTLEKSAAITNGTPEARAFKLSVQLLDSTGAVLSEQSSRVEAKPFERKLAPFSLKLPATATRRDLVLKASLLPEDGAARLDDRFALQTLPKPRMPELASTLYLFDPEGLLADKLGELDIPFKKLKSLQDLPASGALVVGRKALSLAPQPFNPRELADNGLNVLVMEQTPDVSPELLKSRQRTAFINDAAHPALAGLKDCDFSAWSGSATVGKPYANNGANVNWSDWGARNMLATYVFRRPSHGNFVSLLVSGFDLHQTPLLEYRGVKGSWIACQLDLTERLGKSPVPTQLMTQLLDYLDNRGRLERRAAWFGGDAFGQFIDKFGIKAARLPSLSAKELAGVGTLLLSDGDFQEAIRNRDALGDFVYWGGKVVFLQRGDAFNPAWLPFTMKLGQAKIRQALAAPGPWQSGWGDCELYFHEPFALPVFEGFPPQAAASSPAALLKVDFGDGSFLFTSVLPERFGVSPAAGKASRLLSALLTERGVGIANASQPFACQAKPNELDLSELKWEFAVDPDNKGLEEGVQNGSDGSLRWLKGLIADGVEVRVGQPFESFLRREYYGYVWYKIEVDIPASLAAEKLLYFTVGVIDDFDAVYVNGVKVGETGKSTPKWWEVMRVYTLPAGLLKPGANMFAVRVFNEKGGGGIVKGPVKITSSVPKESRAWTTPYPGGVARDYDYRPDIVRMY